MYKKWLSIMMMLGIVMLAAACGASDDIDELTPLEVDLQVPETAEVGETVELKAVVTFGDKKVDDADDVEFEIWVDGEKEDPSNMDDNEASEMIKPNNDGDGVYTAETTFDKDAVYVVQVHVTAEGLHTMPLQKITVGDGEAEDEEK
ncbi:hypothetical protein HNQ35_002466 [Cerasibacillus quisquiliarum]|uniref:YtkA-like domain-containing protein n=1 Tax=Cerasibacillus quisquiliarum TaxID=227865 RepID=A0A511V3D9_9BACI|nr:FixH family protein [Cerasibacillus quisquiliarum]MBB5147248.1 hypothetical protein [Cerasibacillus quisquiliarum]GEN32253.1 hypothetical protein CQU01_24910 [Cerasibacillus quisquiliarum]